MSDIEHNEGCGACLEEDPDPEHSRAGAARIVKISKLEPQPESTQP